MIYFVLALIWLTIADYPASAQSETNLFETPSPPTVGGTSGMENPETLPGFQASGGNEILRHRDFTGAPCLAVGGFARPQAIDPNLYEDVIAVANSCPQRISLQVCYYQSEDCIPMDVPGGERKEAVLGILPSTTEFRFEFREKFE
jgi:hypothetical protein